MKTLIILPAGHDSLVRIALDLKQRLESKFRGMNVTIMDLDKVTPDHFFNHAFILVGTPTVKNDIYWPIQVKIDAIIHTILKHDFSSLCISAFTVFSSEVDARKALDALLWTFHETTANVVDGLCMIDGDGDENRLKRIETFVDHLKKCA